MTAAETDLLARSLAAEAPLTWVITGDSITHGLVHTQGARSYAEHLHELIRGELERRRDIMINSAISGHRVAQILDDFERRIGAWSPQIVTLMIGTNDCSTADGVPFVEPAEFGASIAAFVERVRGIGAIPVLQTPPSVDVAQDPDRGRIADFARATRRVAAAQDVILVDQLARFTALGNGDVLGEGAVPWGLMNDAIHPNAAGHAALALELADALGIRPAPSRTLARLRAEVESGYLGI